MMQVGEYPVCVVANFKGKLVMFEASEEKMVMALPDTKFGRMAPYLNLFYSGKAHPDHTKCSSGNASR